MINKRWSHNAIVGMLGNIEAESSMNPDFWQSGKTNDLNVGYGLVQWIEASKYIDWLPNGADKADIDKQLERILYEAEDDIHHPNTIQWMSSQIDDQGWPRMSFSNFTNGKDNNGKNKSVEDLAVYFMRCYEQCGYGHNRLEVRKNAAKKWDKLISLFK